jgi:hypothetical protein
MKTWNYSVSTATIWTSFDYGAVEAETYEEAREKAIEQLRYDFKKANDAFKHCDVTKGFLISFNQDDVLITEKI